MPWFQIVIREPDPQQLAEAQRLGAQDALNNVLTALHQHLSAPLPDLDTRSAAALGQGLAQFCNNLIQKLQRANDEIEPLENSCQNAYAHLRALRASQSAQRIAQLEQKIESLQAQLASVAAERDQARQLNQRQARQIDQLNQTLVRLGEQVKNKNKRA